MATLLNEVATALYKTPTHSKHCVVTPPTTPTTITTSAHQIFTEIQSIYHELSTLPSLVPGDQVNALLTRLVNLCVSPHSASLASHFSSIKGTTELGENLRTLCAAAEGELEQHWARRIVQSTAEAQESNRHDQSLLHTFPYYQNYLDLSRLECSTLEAFLPCPSTLPTKLAFIGSGPLPLTSLCVLDRYPQATVHNIDRDASALAISQELCERLGYDARMSFAREDVSLDTNGGDKTTDWNAFGIVFLAALVGLDTDSKVCILAALARKLRPGTLVIARSAQGLRSVLYPVLELTNEVERIGLEVLVEMHPWTKVVNSVVVLRVKER